MTREVSDESYPHRTAGSPQRTPVARGARADCALRNMMAWAGRRLWLVVRTMIRAVQLAHHEQVRMWECVLETSGAAPLSAAGPLRWVRSLDGYRLEGSQVPAQDPA